MYCCIIYLFHSSYGMGAVLLFEKGGVLFQEMGNAKLFEVGVVRLCDILVRWE